ncbi:MAG: hypothetical protein QME94_03975 [Anaerolineae bacterium]|nr:hypothetical protein [Anaerolineae bacterium]
MPVEINLGVEQILELVSPYTPEQMHDKVSAKRIDAFGSVAKLIQRPKFEDIEIAVVQKRYEPFWHAVATARYVYDRRRTYRVEVTPEVQSVTIYGHDQPATGERGRSFELEGMEHCQEAMRGEVILDAERGQDAPELARYLKYPVNAVPSIAALQEGGATVVPPEVRGSYVVRKLMAPLLKTFQADKVLEETINVEEVSLYYRPVLAVEYLWKSRDRRQVLEFDGLTGESRAVAGEMKKQVVRILENDALFDIGADVIGTVLPGANIAVKVGRLAARKVVR